MFYEDDIERPATGRRREEEGAGNGNASPRPSTASRDARANRASQLAAKRKERSSIGMEERKKVITPHYTFVFVSLSFFSTLLYTTSIYVV